MKDVAGIKIYLLLAVGLLLASCTPRKDVTVSALGDLSSLFSSPVVGLGVTISQSGSQADPTSSGSPIEFTAVFTQAIDSATFTAADITSSGTATVTTWTIVPVNSTTFLLQAIVTTDGTVHPAIAAMTVKDLVGDDNTASVDGADNQVTLDTVAPSVPSGITLQNPSASPGNSSTPTFTVTGLTVGDTLLLFSNTTCTTQVASIAVTSAVMSVTSAAIAAGSYTFAVRARDDALNASVCASSPTVAYTYDATPPSVTNVTAINVNATYYFSQTISVTVTFTEVVYVTGGATVKIALNSAAGAYGVYSSGSGTNTITLIYTIGAGDAASPLNYQSTSSLVALSGATIRDAANNDAVLTLPATGGAGSLGTNRNIIISNNISLTVNAAYPSNGSYWMDYVKYSSNTNVYSQSDTACLGTENGYLGKYGGCVHGGEIRKVVVTGVTSCTGLTLLENLNLFDWICDGTSGTATFYSTGLKSGMGLQNLIDTSGSPDWKNNYVTIESSGTSIASSTSAKWWAGGNTFSALTNNSGASTYAGVSTLGTSHTIYYITSDQTTIGYNITANNVAIVTLNGSKLSWNNTASNTCDFAAAAPAFSADTQYMICGGASNKFTWIEANFTTNAGVKPHGALLMTSWNYSQIRNSTFNIFYQSPGSTSYNTINLEGGKANLFLNLKFKNVGQSAIYLGSATYNYFQGVSIGNADGGTAFGAIYLSVSDDNTFVDTKIADVTRSDSAGIYVDNSARNRFIRTNIANIATGSTSAAINITGTSSLKNIFTQTVVSGTANAGIQLEAQANSNIFMSLTATNNIYNGIYLTGASTSSNYFVGAAIANVNASNKPIETTSNTSGNAFDKIAVSGGTQRVSLDGTGTNNIIKNYLLVDSTSSGSCGALGNVLTTCQTSGSPSYTTLVGNIMTSTWVGRLSNTPADTTNASAISAGSNQVAFGSVTDWFSFDHFFRAWGKSDVSTWGTTHAGACTSSNCQIWDWALKSSSTLMLNKVFDGSTSNAATLSGSCPASLDGNSSAATTSTNNTGVYYMLHAIEYIGQGGNDNGLCEANESCIFAPNIGAYQGHGSISTNFCTTSGTYVSNAKIYQYSTNGY